jgi:hypothetical protein
MRSIAFKVIVLGILSLGLCLTVPSVYAQTREDGTPLNAAPAPVGIDPVGDVQVLDQRVLTDKTEEEAPAVQAPTVQLLQIQPLRMIQLEPQVPWMINLQTSVTNLVVEPLADSFNKLTIDRVLLTKDKIVVGWLPQVKYKWEVEQLSQLRMFAQGKDNVAEKVATLTPTWKGEVFEVSTMPEAERQDCQANYDAGIALAKKYSTSLLKTLKEFNPDKVFKDDKGRWNVKLVDEAGQERIFQLDYNPRNKQYSLFTPFAAKKEAADLTKLDVEDPDKPAVEEPEQASFSMSWTLTAPNMAEVGALVHSLLLTGFPNQKPVQLPVQQPAQQPLFRMEVKE